MTYATIMVSLASDQPNERCLAIASEMVERFNARVVGIAAAELVRRFISLRVSKPIS